MKAFGGLLVFLLLGFGLYLYMAADNAQKVTTAAKPAREAAEEISGQGMRGSFTLEPVEANGKITGLRIKTLDPKGMLAKIYAVQVDDVILGMGPLTVKDNDADTVEAQVLQAGSNPNAEMTILRNGQKMTLKNTGAAARMNGKGSIPGLPAGIPSH